MPPTSWSGKTRHGDKAGLATVADRSRSEALLPHPMDEAGPRLSKAASTLRFRSCGSAGSSRRDAKSS
jgi:hypothetical protein